MNLTAYDVNLLSNAGIEVDSKVREDILNQLVAENRMLIADRNRLDSCLRISHVEKSVLRNEFESVKDTRNTWRLWCLIMAGGMLLSIVGRLLAWGGQL